MCTYVSHACCNHYDCSRLRISYCLCYCYSVAYSQERLLDTANVHLGKRAGCKNHALNNWGRGEIPFITVRRSYGSTVSALSLSFSCCLWTQIIDIWKLKLAILLPNFVTLATRFTCVFFTQATQHATVVKTQGFKRCMLCVRCKLWLNVIC